MPMKNIFHFKSFLNFLSRNKLFTAINVFGFAVSLMFVVLLGLYVQDELSVDSFHANKDRIFRVEYEGSAKLPPGLPALLEARYPEIETSTRVMSVSGEIDPIAGFTDEEISVSGMAVDSGFFNIFSFPFVEGSAASAMRTRDDIVLTQRFARRLFGQQEAVGRSLRIAGHDFTVSGVVRDFEHTHFANPQMVVSIHWMPLLWLGIENPKQASNIMGIVNGAYDIPVYLMGRENTDLAARLDTAELAHAFRDVFELTLFQRGDLRSPRLTALEDVYLTPLASRSTVYNDRTYLLVLRLAAMVILLFAVINYINLSVAQSGFRAQEAATRRLLGGSKGSLFAGFVLESLIICFVSLCLGVLLSMLVEPWFRRVMWTNISVEGAFTAGNIALALAGVVVIGVISGLVPAYVLTRFKPIDVVRGTFKRQTKMVYSKVLIAFQYCITIALIGCTVTIMRQLDFMRHSDLGFDTEQLIVCGNRFTATRMDGVRGELMSVPGVSAVSFSHAVPGIGNYNGRYGHYDIDGKLHNLAGFFGDTAFLRVFGIETLRETGLRESDGAQIWLTEAAWRDLELAPDATEYTRGDGERFKFKIAGCCGISIRTISRSRLFRLWCVWSRVCGEPVFLSGCREGMLSRRWTASGKFTTGCREATISTGVFCNKISTICTGSRSGWPR